MHVCMWSLASSVQAVQAEIYRVRSFWSCPGPGDWSLHIAPHAIPLASRLRPLATHRGAAQGATAEEVFSRTYSDLCSTLLAVSSASHWTTCMNMMVLRYELWMRCRSIFWIFKYHAVLCIFCMCGKDPRLKWFLFLEQRLEISRIGIGRI